MKLDSYQTTLDSGSHWSLIVRRGIELRLTDLSGGANVGALFYNPTQLSECYNAPDTLKCQHTFKLTKGHCLHSDMGRIFCSITDDSFGWHESVCGNSHPEHVDKQWGARDYQTQSNGWKQNGNDSFLVELAKYRLSKRDLRANVNFFSCVSADEQGVLALTKRSTAGDAVTLRFEMDTLLVLHTCPHPLNKDAEYPQAQVSVELQKAAPVKDDDLCMNSHAENLRGFKNNALFHFGL